jgi:hypothetical protein
METLFFVYFMIGLSAGIFFDLFAKHRVRRKFPTVTLDRISKVVIIVFAIMSVILWPFTYFIWWYTFRGEPYV